MNPKYIETEFFNIFNCIKDAVMVIDNRHQVVFMNQTVEKMFSKSMCKIFNHDITTILELKDNNDNKILPDPIINVLQSETTEIKDHTARLCLKNGYSWPIEFSVNKINNKAIFIFRKSVCNASESDEAKLQNALESAVDGIILVNKEGIIYQANNAFCTLIGISREAVIGKSGRILAQQLLEGKDRTKIFSYLKDIFHGKIVDPYILEFNNRIFEIHTPVARDYLDFTVIFHDITERIQQENRIRSSLHEKDILLQEIHHRVKNNLQIISSLLHLQSFQFNDEKILDCIKQSQNRIRTMAILHEQLYQTDDFAHIDFEYYLRTLTRHLLNQHTLLRNHISLQLKIEKCEISIENAVYCGLIINELTSNALKYAYPEGQKGNIAISMRKLPKKKDTFELTFKNDGNHIPENINIRKTRTLGLRLVRLLSEEQMHGKLIFKRSPITTFQITFKKENPAKLSQATS